MKSAPPPSEAHQFLQIVWLETTPSLQSSGYGNFISSFGQCLSEGLYDKAFYVGLEQVEESVWNCDLVFLTAAAARVAGAHAMAMLKATILKAMETPGELSLEASLLVLRGSLDEGHAMKRFVDEVEASVDINMMELAADLCLDSARRHGNDRRYLVYAAGKVSLGSRAQVDILKDMLRAFLEADPNDHQVRQVYAVILSVAKKIAESLEQFAMVPDEELRHDARWIWLVTMVDAHREEEVKAWFEKRWPTYAPRVEKEDRRVFLKFLWSAAENAMRYEKQREACRLYGTLIRHDPGGQRWYLELGQLLARMGRPASALPVLRRGLNLTQNQIDDQASYCGTLGYGQDEVDRLWKEMQEEVNRLEALPPTSTSPRR